MESPSIAIIIDTAVQIILVHEKAVTISCTPEEIRIKFPTSRLIGKALKLPHEYILDFYTLMEEEGLITREERIGVFTTGKGTTRIASVMRDQYPKESISLLGEPMLHLLAGNLPKNSQRSM